MKYISHEKATEFIVECLKHEEKLQSVERETLIAIKNYLDRIPAADVRPVVRSFWGYNPDDNIPYCDNCGMPQDMPSDFCHSCGADMREEC